MSRIYKQLYWKILLSFLRTNLRWSEKREEKTDFKGNLYVLIGWYKLPSIFGSVWFWLLQKCMHLQQNFKLFYNLFFFITKTNSCLFTERIKNNFENVIQEMSYIYHFIDGFLSAPFKIYIYIYIYTDTSIKNTCLV